MLYLQKDLRDSAMSKKESGFPADVINGRQEKQAAKKKKQGRDV
jgi:hypothetical protein